MRLLALAAVVLLLTGCASRPAIRAEVPAPSKTYSVKIHGADVNPPSHVEMVSVGDKVTVQVRSDRDDELHVHPTMVAKRIVAGEVTTVRFRIDGRGTYYIEAHNSGTLLLQLVAS